MSTNQPMTPHYYVYCLTAGNPTVRHATLAEAQAEAERLAEKHPGRAFEILRCVGIAQTSKASTFWMDGEGPPEKPRYRELEEGEILQQGDEYELFNTWRQVPQYSFGITLEDPLLRTPHRRPL